MPTILDIVNLEAPPRAQGKSLMPLVGGADWEPVLALAEGAIGSRETVSIRSARYKYIISMPGPTGRDHPLPLPLENIEEELYDLERDPDEQEDVPNLRPMKLRYFRAKLEELLERSRQEREFVVTRAPLEDATKEQLRALGYMR